MEATGKLLIVEGDRAAAERLRALVSADGYEARVVYTGEAALQESAGADLLLLDMALPDQPGFDILRRIRKERPELVIVVLMAPGSMEGVVAAMKAGAADIVANPPEPARLSRALRDAWQEAQARRELDVLSAETGDLRLDDVLNELVLKGGSDLHLKVGRPPMLRIAGELRPSELRELSDEDMRGMLLRLLGREGLRELEEQYERDASYELPGIARFRANAFKRLGRFGAAFRLIPLAIPTIERMKLPAALKEITKVPHGLVLVTGPTGSGKSTTLAAMMDHLNETQALHVVTIEDPVEFIYADRNCVINQRQLGSDVKSLHEALRRTLRQDPDVILMGEMRDRESMELAMHAAETGHLVLSTLHTNDAKQTLDRVIDSFPSGAQPQIRAQLALTLRAVVSQRLVRRADGQGQVAAVEIMLNSPNIRELIQEGKTSAIEKAMAASGDYYGMQTFNQALAQLVASKTIGEEEALAASASPGDLRLLLKGVQSGGSSIGAPPAPASDTTRAKFKRGF